MDALQKLAGIKDSHVALGVMIDESIVEVQGLADQKFQEGKAVGYSEGLAASGTPAGDKIYSQAEMDNGVAVAIKPLQEELQAVKDSIQPQIDAAVAPLNEKIEALKAAIKVELEDKASDTARLELAVAGLV